MNRHFFAALLFCSLISPSSWAITNIEIKRPGLPDEGVSGAVEIGISGKTGDQKEQDQALNTRLNYRQGDDLFFAIGARNYGKVKNAKDTDDTFLHLRWMHSLTRHFATEVFTQWEENEFSNLKSRTLAGGGGRFLVADKPKVYSLSLGLGAFREFESLDLASYTQKTALWRINSYYTYSHNLTATTTLASTTYIQPAVDDFKDLRALFTVGLSVKITDALNLGINYEAKFDSNPARNLAVTPVIDKHKTNTQYQTSLSYHF